MTSSDIAGLIIMSLLGLLIVVIAVFCLLGKGSFYLRVIIQCPKRKKKNMMRNPFANLWGKSSYRLAF